MKQASLTVFLCSLVSIIFMVTGIQPTWASKDKPIKILYGTFDPPQAIFSQVAKQWATELEEKTNGRVKVELSFGFGKPGEMYDMVTKGMIDVAQCIPGFTPGMFPYSEIVGLPFVIPTAEIGSKAITRFVEKGYKDRAYNAVKPLFYFTCSGDSIITKKRAVKQIEDLKGLKIHAGGPQISDRIKLMGGIPVFIPYPELYGALEKGIVDGMVMGYAIMEIFRLHEVTNYNVEPPMGTGALVYVMNNRKWKKLPADIQQTIDELSQKYHLEYARAWDASCKRGKDLFRKAGGQEFTLDSEQISIVDQQVASIWEKWINGMEKRKLDGKKAVNEFYNILKDLGVENPAIGYTP